MNIGCYHFLVVEGVLGLLWTSPFGTAERKDIASQMGNMNTLICGRKASPTFV